VPGQSSDGPVRSAKQEITETIKFLRWLDETHHRTAVTCNQQDIDEYLASGPTTRHSIRTFFVWAKSAKINRSVQIGHRQAKTTRTLTQDQRLAWLKELLGGCRVAFEVAARIGPDLDCAKSVGVVTDLSVPLKVAVCWVDGPPTSLGSDRQGVGSRWKWRHG
jgi:hypothetical protein